MKISTFTIEPGDVLSEKPPLETASFLSVHGNCLLDPHALQIERLGGHVHGATSCLGAMTEAGISDKLAVFAIEDPEGAYGTALEPFGQSPRLAARTATAKALESAGRPGEAPELVWLSCTPGQEEEVIAGIEHITGPDVPIVGGSAADNSVRGDWFVFDRQRKETAGVIVSVMFPSRPVSFAYHSGYAPTQDFGVVTRSEGRRVFEIDGRQAFEVYREWTKGKVGISTDTDAMQSILSQSSLAPLGRKVAELGGIASYLLAHPAAAASSGAIDFFASIEEGETLTQMSGTETSLVERAGRVAALARTAGHLEKAPIAGALMVYCGGCMLTVRERLSDVVSGVSSSLDDAPFLGMFTFGEQGSILGTGNRHGNLMISCVVFG